MPPIRITTDSLLNRSWTIFRAGFVSFTTLALIFYSPVILIRLFVSWQSSPNSVDLDLSGCLLLFAILMLFPIASAALAVAVFQGLRGQATTITQCILVAVSRGQSIVGVAILSSVASLLGYLMCLLPGIVVFCGLFLAGPIVVIEKIDPAAAMRRSWALTDGYKRSIFSLYFAIVVLQLGAHLLINSAFDINTFDWTQPPASSHVIHDLLGDLIAVLTTAFSGIAAAVAYHDIRAVREGLNEDDSAAVFD